MTGRLENLLTLMGDEPKTVSHGSAYFLLGKEEVCHWELLNVNKFSHCRDDGEPCPFLSVLGSSGHTSSGLSASAGIVRPKLKTLPASAPEGRIFGYRKMAALATDISPVRNGGHWHKLVA